LALVGSVLVTSESGFYATTFTSPEAVMASHDVSVPHESSTDRDRMLATLASYDSGPELR